jgi:response regulator NasT
MFRVGAVAANGALFWLFPRLTASWQAADLGACRIGTAFAMHKVSNRVVIAMVIQNTLRLMLVAEGGCQATFFAAVQQETRHQVVTRLECVDPLVQEVFAVQPDVVVIYTDYPAAVPCRPLQIIAEQQPTPIAIFSQHGDTEFAQQAIRAGVSAFVVDGFSASRIDAVIDVALVRFQEHDAMRRELEDVRARLAERKIVERAKGILMHRRQLSEEEAYHSLRKTAMDHNIRIAEAAERLLNSAELPG